MMNLRPDGRVDLEHRAYFLRPAQPRTVIVAAAEGGVLSIVTLGSATERVDGLPGKIRCVAPHPSDRRLALIDGVTGSLVVQDYAGNRFFDADPPQVDDDAPNWIKPGFEACLFDDSGELLWLAAPRNGEECEIQLLETAGWSLVARITVEDPFGGSSYSFHHTGRPGLISIWLAAGQDGQQVYWLNRDGKQFSCVSEPHLTNTIPPIFSPRGERLAVINEDNAVCQYEFPSMRCIGSPLISGEEDNPFQVSVAFLSERQILAGTGNGRIFIVDARRTRIEDEVALEGHDPKPIGVYYLRLAHEPGLGTDISYFERLGDAIFFVCRRGRVPGTTEWKDTLLWVTAKPRD
jgi:hypothetical protein